MTDNLLPRGDDVAQQAHNGFGPLSELRGNIATITSAIVVVISSAMLLFAVKDNEKREGIHFLVFTTALLILSVVLGEMVRRLCLVSEEIKHKHARYRGNWKDILKTTFTFNNSGSILVVAIASTLTLCFVLHEQYEVFSSPGFSILFFLNCLVVPQLSFLVGLRQLSPVETSDLNEKENKNVADGLAWSYYFGYLKLVLPRLGYRISESDTFRHKITDEKLFILLPKTCYAFEEISKADDRVKWAGKLPASKINRAGILERSYQHAVHRIEMPRPDGTVDEYHFVLEYATPLMSLYEMSSHAKAPLTGPERDHQVNKCDLLCNFRYMIINICS